ncbi:MAG TPA: amidase [Thermoleophilaceae bacterium]|jgi:amidase
MTAAEQAAAVRSGEVSARELVQASLDAIERLDPEVNAFVTLAADRALAEADAIDRAAAEPGEPEDGRPLAGVPVGVKDVGVLTEGIRTTFGSALAGDFVPTFDTAPVARLRAAGAIVVGKTNTPEFGITPVTEPDRFGPTRNPWDPSRTAGGSSGGSAAAVAAGMVALAHGSDGGGSIRIPASCCGLVGLKPSRGRVSNAPLPEAASGLVADGVLTHTVEDTALALDVLAGYEWGDAASPPPPRTSFADAAGREPGRLRVGLAVVPPTGDEVDPECAAATRETAELLESLGHEVEESAPRWDDEAALTAFLDVWAADMAISVEPVRRMSPDPDAIEPLTRELLDRARSLPPLRVLEALTFGRRYSRRVVRWWADHDVLVTPTLARPPIPHGSLDPPPGEPAMAGFDAALRFVPFTPTFNVTGQPAISLPLHESADGLPVGVQLVGPPAGEELLLSLAAQVERAAPWADRRPAPVAAR